MARTRAGPQFQALFQFQLLGINGAFLTGDLFNLFVFFEVLLIAFYALLLHGLGPQRVGAAVHVVVLNLIGSALFLFAVGTLYGVTGTLNLADLARVIPRARCGDRAARPQWRPAAAGRVRAQGGAAAARLLVAAVLRRRLRRDRRAVRRADQGRRLRDPARVSARVRSRGWRTGGRGLAVGAAGRARNARLRRARRARGACAARGGRVAGRLFGRHAARGRRSLLRSRLCGRGLLHGPLDAGERGAVPARRRRGAAAQRRRRPSRRGRLDAARRSARLAVHRGRRSDGRTAAADRLRRQDHDPRRGARRRLSPSRPGACCWWPRWS